jgi:hypothetical protein
MSSLPRKLQILPSFAMSIALNVICCALDNWTALFTLYILSAVHAYPVWGCFYLRKLGISLGAPIYYSSATKD